VQLVLSEQQALPNFGFFSEMSFSSFFN